MKILPHVYLHNKENRSLRFALSNMTSFVTEYAFKARCQTLHLSNDAMVFEQQEAASCSPLNGLKRDTGCQIPAYSHSFNSARACRCPFVLIGLYRALDLSTSGNLGLTMRMGIFSVQACGHTSEIELPTMDFKRRPFFADTQSTVMCHLTSGTVSTDLTENACR